MVEKNKENYFHKFKIQKLMPHRIIINNYEINSESMLYQEDEYYKLQNKIKTKIIINDLTDSE